MGQDGVTELNDRVIAHKLGETNLVIHDDESLCDK